MIVDLYGVSLCLLMPSVLCIGGFGELGSLNVTFLHLSIHPTSLPRGTGKDAGSRWTYVGVRVPRTLYYPTINLNLR